MSELEGGGRGGRKKAPAHRSGFVALVGRPNVGKSTLLNAILGERLAIATPKPQTTRNRIVGIHHAPSAQICFVDTPGIHRHQGALNRYLNQVALGELAGADLVLWLVEASGLVREDRYVRDRIREARPPAWVAINKIDRLADKHAMLPIMAELHETGLFEEIHPICALDGDGLPALVEGLGRRLPEAPPLFPEDMLTDGAERFFVAELVREQLLLLTHQEVPYDSAVVVQSFEDGREEGGAEARDDGAAGSAKPAPMVRIRADVVVARDSQKGIVIGQKGARLKAIGTEARKHIEAFLGAKVYLELFVRVDPEWSRTEKGLRRVGYE